MKAVIVLATLALCAAALTPTAQAQAQINDVDILNFALNLEYLEAEFYLAAVYGKGLTSKQRGGGPAPTGGRKVNFASANVKRIATEIANDEKAHVLFLRAALGKAAVPAPRINIGSAFADAADAALMTKLSPRFSPYASNKNDLLFLHGAFIFEDVGVTAYKGAARFIANKDYLEAAAGILSVEAYHAGSIRTQLFMKAQTIVAPYGAPVYKIVSAISALRGKVGGGADQGIVKPNMMANIVPTDANGIAFSRSTGEVLRIVYLGGKSKGGFFPSGLNGRIKSA